MLIGSRRVRKILPYRVCPAYEIFVKLIFQVIYFLSYIFRAPHCSLEHCCLISVLDDCLENSLYFWKKTVINDFWCLRCVIWSRCRWFSSIDFSSRLDEKRDFHTSSTPKLKSGKTSAIYLLPDKDSFAWASLWQEAYVCRACPLW